MAEAIVNVLELPWMYRTVFCFFGVPFTVDSPNGRNGVNVPDHAELVLQTEHDLAAILCLCMAETIAVVLQLKLKFAIGTRARLTGIILLGQSLVLVAKAALMAR